MIKWLLYLRRWVVSQYLQASWTGEMCQICKKVHGQGIGFPFRCPKGVRDER